MTYPAYRLQLGFRIVVSCKTCGCYLLKLISIRLHADRVFKAVYHCGSCGGYTTDLTTIYKKKKDIEEPMYMNTKRMLRSSHTRGKAKRGYNT